MSSSGKPYVAASVNASSPEIGVLAGELLEHLQAALERLAEALLLGPHDPLDLVRVLDELGVRPGHLLDHDTRQPVDVASSPIRLALLHGAADDAAARCSRGPRSRA